MANNISVDGNVTVGGNQTLTGNLTVAGSLSYFGVGVATQATLVAAVVTTGTVTTGFGFSTTTQGNAIIAAVNSILATMKTFGLMATT